jgi:hypothetical protein
MKAQADAGQWRQRRDRANSIGLIADDDVNQLDAGASGGEEGPADERHSGHRDQKLRRGRLALKTISVAGGQYDCPPDRYDSTHVGLSIRASSHIGRIKHAASQSRYDSNPKSSAEVHGRA